MNRQHFHVPRRNERIVNGICAAAVFLLAAGCGVLLAWRG